MEEIGQGARALIAPSRAPGAARRDAIWAGATAGVALVAGLSMWGFAVDDAWIPVRYARHLVAGAGYVFNAPGGRVTDGVTPLPYPWILAPLADAPAAGVLLRAKYMGLVAWGTSAAWLGARLGRVDAPAWTKVAAIVVLGLAVPTSAHAVTGLETALAMTLATSAACALPRPRLAALLSGLAAALRPEMAPWALVIGAGAPLAHAKAVQRSVVGAMIAIVPFFACVVVRLLVFGRPAPLAVWAKPSDLEHGLTYAAVAALVTLTPILVIPSRALLRAPSEARVLVAAALAHLAAVAAVGGDWMPYARLVAPIAPSLVLAFVISARAMHAWAARGRALVAIVFGLYLQIVAAPEGRHVAHDRDALVALARPLLAPSHRIAALDIGWTSAASDAEIVDLAGLTDPEIAALPGGHTSKRIDAAYLIARAPDAVLFYVAGGVDDRHLDAWKDATYTRVVEARLAASDVFAAHYAPRAFLPLGSRGAGYVLFVASPP